jgi:diadenosine tetraphosphatase ApaH/serine/threonine PP2A family protein phosphatase
VRYAVLSDVHGNLEALSAVLADAAYEGALGVLCLGDAVGYGADPVACVELLGERSTGMVAGNHEYGALGLLDLRWFNPVARAAALWTREQLGADHQGYLSGLPLSSALGEATCVHASPRRPEEWDYLLSAEDGFEAFPDFATRLCFVGHSHRPGVWSLGSSGPAHEDLGGPAWHDHRIPFHDGRRYIVNVGSVGQPRDRDPRAAYVVWDEDERSITLRRVMYDHKAAAAKILRAGLPRALADRLAHGM